MDPILRSSIVLFWSIVFRYRSIRQFKSSLKLLQTPSHFRLLHYTQIPLLFPSTFLRKCHIFFSSFFLDFFCLLCYFIKVHGCIIGHLQWGRWNIRFPLLFVRPVSDPYCRAFSPFHTRVYAESPSAGEGQQEEKYD